MVARPAARPPVLWTSMRDLVTLGFFRALLGRLRTKHPIELRNSQKTWHVPVRDPATESKCPAPSMRRPVRPSSGRYCLGCRWLKVVCAFGALGPWGIGFWESGDLEGSGAMGVGLEALGLGAIGCGRKRLSEHNRVSTSVGRAACRW